MFPLPPDQYGVQPVLWHVLDLPCIAVWFYALIFHLPSFWLAGVLAILLGLATAWLLAWLLFLLGYAGMALLERCCPGRRDDG
jgi:hypothetical protein